MERIFEIYVQGETVPESVFTETELRWRIATLKNEWKHSFGYTPNVISTDIQDTEINILLHGKPKINEIEEWKDDFPDPADNRFWDIGPVFNGDIYRQAKNDWLAKMPRGK